MLMPEHSAVYKMKKAVAKELFSGSVKTCVVGCGNRFRYFQDGPSYTNMECIKCGYQYHTTISTFGERYERDGSTIDNPNFLFKRLNLSKVGSSTKIHTCDLRSK